MTKRLSSNQQLVTRHRSTLIDKYEEFLGRLIMGSGPVDTAEPFPVPSCSRCTFIHPSPFLAPVFGEETVGTMSASYQNSIFLAAKLAGEVPVGLLLPAPSPMAPRAPP